MRFPAGQSPEFEKLIQGSSGPVDLIAIALEIAQDFAPSLQIASYLDQIEGLAGRVRQRCARLDDPRQILGQINWVLFVEEGYRGNAVDYYDPKNSYLNEVIDRKVGIPLTLSLIYWRIAERMNLDVNGLNTPGHFFLRINQEILGDAKYVDPFHEGKRLDRDGCQRTIAQIQGGPVVLTDSQFQACPPRIVIARLLGNLKAIHLALEDYHSLLLVQRRLAVLLRDDPIEQRDLGMLYCQLERSIEAIPLLESFLAKCPDNPEAETVRSLLKSIRRESALRN